MKKLFILPFIVATFLYVLTAVHLPEAIAANVKDGTYQIDFEMLQAENDSVSIANDYFEKPARLTVENGEHYLQFTVNHSEWVKVLQSTTGDSFADVHILSEDLEGNHREVAFKVDGDISDPLFLQMHVVIEDMEPAYDHKYAVRLALDLESLEETDGPAVILPVFDTEKGQGNKQKVFIYILLAALIIFVLIGVRKLNSSKNKK